MPLGSAPSHDLRLTWVQSSGTLRRSTDAKVAHGPARALKPPAQSRKAPTRLRRVRNSFGGSAPEVVRRVGVAGMKPLLGDVAVLDVEDLDGVVVEGLALPLAPRPSERHGVLVVGQDRVEVDLEGPAGQLAHLLAGGEDLLPAPVGPRQLVASGGVPDDVVGE